MKHVEEYIKSQEKQGSKIIPSGLIGFIYLKNGQKEKAVYHFKNSVDRQQKVIQEGPKYPVLYDYLHIAGIYSVMGEKELAMENLRKAAGCKEAENLPLAFRLIFYKNDPLWDTIRNEPEFKELFQNMEEKYLADREKIKKLFREAGLYD